MPNVIQHKRNSTSGAVPTTGVLSQGELGINIADGKLYTKNNNNAIINIGVTSISGTLITPASGNFINNVLTGSGTVSAPSHSFNDNPNTGFYNPATNAIGIATSGVSRLHIDNLGNVGINTTAPQNGFKLDVNGAAVVRGNILTNGTIQEFGNARYQLHSGAAGNQVSYVCNGGGRFGVGFTAPSGIAAISGGVAIGSNYNLTPPTDGLIVQGNVGVGTFSPSTKLHISDTNDLNTTIEYTTTTLGFASGVRPLKLLLTGSSGVGVGAGVGIDFVTKSSSTEYTGARIVSNRTDTSNNHALTFWAGGGTISLSEYMRIASNGNVGIGTTNPAEALEISGALKLVNCSARLQRYDNSSVALSGNTNGHFGIALGNYNTLGRVFRLASYADGTNAGSFRLRDDSSGSDRLILSSAGNLGINADPADRIHVSGAQTTLRLNNSLGYDTQLRLIDSVSDWSVGVNTTNSAGSGYFNIRSNTAGLHRMVIDTAGNIGVNTNLPLQRLHVSGDINIEGSNGLRINNTATSGQYLRGDGTRFVSSSIQAGDVPTLNQNTTGSAATLTTTRTLWGQNFNGSTNVTGTLTNVGDITGTAALNLTATGGTLGLISTGSNIITMSTNGSERLRVDSSGNIGVGTSSPGYRLQVNGSFGATTKSFRINHPSKNGYSLEYGSLESPYHGVRLTGRGKVVKGVGSVILPYYLKDLIHDDDTLNIQITNYKHSKTIYVDQIDLKNDRFIVKADRAKTLGELNFFWTLTGVRKDVDHLVVEKEN